MRMRMRTPEPSGNFTTKDFWLAAALLSAGKKLLGLDWREGRAYFIFQDLADCEATAEAYWRKDLKVVAKDFADSLRTLKDRLHGSRP